MQIDRASDSIIGANLSTPDASAFASVQVDADPSATSVIAVFEAVVLRQGRSTAAVHGVTSLTYAQLNNRANALALELLRVGVRAADLVGVFGERSIDIIVAMLAVLKVGAAYVPVDPEWPAARRAFLALDCGFAALVVTGDAAASAVATGAFPVVVTSLADGSVATPNRALCSRGSSAAYVMYTSGSSGTPKGVVVEHRGIVRLVLGQPTWSFSADDVWLHCGPLTFDASTIEIWGALLNGGRLIIAPKRAALDELGQLIREQRVTCSLLTTGIFNLMIEQRPEDLIGMRLLMTGGDVMSPFHVRRALELLPQVTIVNAYGPTENTVVTCAHSMRHGCEVPDPVPIGRPIACTTVYILDTQGQPVAPGVLGELYTGGDGVARGYLNNAVETAVRFLPDPFRTMPGALMYRTGDLVRAGDDGCFEFCGRADAQIKILGHRIEPAEVEASIAAHPNVTRSCVIAVADETGAKRLVAYYVAAGAGLEAMVLRRFLAERVPAFLVPALLVPLPEMPMTDNGKIDRHALPRPSLRTTAQNQTFAVDASIEDIITAIWTAAIGCERVGLDDNFFDLGGDSLRLVAVHADLQRHLAREIPIVDLFAATTVRALAMRLRGDAPVARGLAADHERAQLQKAAFKRRSSGHKASTVSKG